MNNEPKPTAWKTLSRKLILDYGKFLKVEEHCIELPDGRVIPDWSWIITPDFINVVAVDEAGRFICFRQTKYGIDGTAIAPVGGYLNPDEDPLAGARRELLEETGYESDCWTDLGRYRIDPNRGAGWAHFYLADRSRFVAASDSDDLEEQTLILLNRAELEGVLARGEVKVLAWHAIFLLALNHLAASDCRVAQGPVGQG